MKTRKGFKCESCNTKEDMTHDEAMEHLGHDYKEPHHTPGPWTLWEDRNMPITLNECHAIRSGVEDVCFIEKTDRDLSDARFIDIDLANARLIAAAPELLEFIKMLLAGSKDELPADHPAMKSEKYLTDVAETLIAKAEGK